MGVEIRVNVFTSCYSKILKRHKSSNDIYIRVSRGLFMPQKGVDGKSVMSMIDVNLGSELGMYEATLGEYERRITGRDYDEVLSDLAEMFSPKSILQDFSDDELKEIESDVEGLEKTKIELEKTDGRKRLDDFNSLSESERESLSLYGLTEDSVRSIGEWKPMPTYNFFILCFEDLESRYTEKDEKKNPDCKAGTFKTCHRTIIAKVLNERYKLDIREY